MQIEIQVRGSAVDDTLRALIRRRLRFALGSASHRVHNVAVVLDDQNGPRGGFDKQCTMRAILPGLTPVIIEQTEADVQVAIDRAADRLGRAVARRIDRAAGARPALSSTDHGITDPQPPR